MEGEQVEMDFSQGIAKEFMDKMVQEICDSVDAEALKYVEKSLMELDFEEDAANLPVGEDAMARLAELAKQQIALELLIDSKEKQLSEVKLELKKISENSIPDLMSEIGMSEFKLTDGSKVTVKPFYSGTYTEEGANWLKENGHDAIIKKSAELDFGRMDTEECNSILALIKDVGEIGIKQKEGIHHATLSSFIKEQVTTGKSFPLELFKGFIGHKTKIVKP